LPVTFSVPIELPGASTPPLEVSWPMIVPLPPIMPPDATTMLLVRLPFTVRRPADTVVPPPTTLLPVRISCPAPVLVRLPLPEIAPA